MTSPKTVRTLQLASLAGVLFAGYLAGVKVFTGACSALIGSCAYLFDVPTCIYGFILFATLFLLTLWLDPEGSSRRHYGVVASVAFIGMLFSGYFGVTEWFSGAAFPLGAPTCVYGLIVFVLIFVVAARQYDHLGKSQE